MVKIYIEDCDENLTEYEVDLAASVRRLKGEIEETEGNSRWEQCLKFEGRELYDDRSLFSSFIREYSVVQLSANGTGGLGAIEADKRGNARSVREIELELPELRQVYHDIRGGIGGIEGEGGIGSRGAGERERPRSWRKHVEGRGSHTGGLGVIEADNRRNAGSEEEPKAKEESEAEVEVIEVVPQASLSYQWGRRRKLEVEPHLALYDWDGDMKHPKTNGVPLRKGMRVHLDEVATKRDASGNEDIWCLGRREEIFPGPIGWIPRLYIRSPDSQYIWSENASTSDSEPAPGLPAFPFPSAAPLEYKLHLGEKGHSYVKATLKYETCEPPGQPTLVNVQLECVGTSDRCISSVSLKITSPDQTVRDVKSPEANKFGAQTPVHVEVTKRQTAEHHGELHFAAAQVPFGADAGASRQNEQTQSESGTRQSQMHIKGSVYSKDTAHWAVDGARGVGERDCVPDELQGMSFVLEEKPAVFLYECYVTTVKNGQRKEHSGESKGLFGKQWKGKGRFGF